MMKFGEALEIVKSGGKVSRQGWNGRGQWIALQGLTRISEMTRPFIYIHTVSRDLVPWLASQTDMLAEDWVVVRDE